VRVYTILFLKSTKYMRRLLSVLCSNLASMRSVFDDPRSFIRQRHTRISIAMTLVELLIVVAMVGTLAAIGVPAYNNYIDKTRNHQAIEDIRFIEAAIKMFRTERGDLPDSLDQVPSTQLSDPWDNTYRYFRIAGRPEHEVKGKWRMDHSQVPVNSDFDLYSMGKDGRSNPRFTAQMSRDDIVRANDGAYVGSVLDY
jgi:general secretion pathway protein G